MERLNTGGLAVGLNGCKDKSKGNQGQYATAAGQESVIILLSTTSKMDAYKIVDYLWL